MPTTYTPTTTKQYKLKEECKHLNVPENVSFYGAAPHPIEAYDIVDKPSIEVIDHRGRLTYNNYFYGEIVRDLEHAKELCKLLNAPINTKTIEQIFKEQTTLTLAYLTAIFTELKKDIKAYQDEGDEHITIETGYGNLHAYPEEGKALRGSNWKGWDLHQEIIIPGGRWDPDEYDSNSIKDTLSSSQLAAEILAQCARLEVHVYDEHQQENAHAQLETDSACILETH